jgi:hypothetical protein
VPRRNGLNIGVSVCKTQFRGSLANMGGKSGSDHLRIVIYVDALA